MSMCNNCGHSNLVHKKNKYKCDIPRCKCREFETKKRNYKYQFSPYLYGQGKINGVSDIKRIEINKCLKGAKNG